MKTINLKIDEIKKIDNLIVCLGYFDALHKGHLQLINRAKLEEGHIALLSFSENPKSLFNSNTKEVNTLSRKKELLEDIGIDYFLLLDACNEVLSLSPIEFIDRVIIPLGCKTVICGFDYTFGKDRKGDSSTLISLSNNRFKVIVLEEVKGNDEMKISSSRIISLLSEGKIIEANEYLYKPYSIKSNVIHGNHIGTTIGFPTANIELDSKYMILKNGVYSAYCIVDGKKYLSMVNVGKHPTIKKNEKDIIEIHIFDFNKDIYGMEIELIFIEYIREEIEFSSLDDLISQLHKDKSYILLRNKEK